VCFGIAKRRRYRGYRKEVAGLKKRACRRFKNMNSSYKLKTFENVGYNALGKIIQLFFQSAANIILARNLVSSDYGIAGFAMIVVGFVAQFGDMGISTAAVQVKKLDEEGLYTGFTIKAALGLVVCAAALVLAPLAGLFFDRAGIVNVVKLLSLNFVINSFAFLPNITLIRELNYRKLLTPQLASVAVNSVLAIFLARKGFGYWSIILANILSTAVFVIVLNIVRPVKIRFQYNPEKAAEFLRFGGNVFFTGLLAFLIFNVDNFIIGVFKGAKDLGYYALAFTWGSMICGILGGVVLSVIFPTLSKLQGDLLRLKKAYLRVLEYVSFFGILVNAGLLMVSREFLYLLLGRGGEKWLPALGSLQILCIYGVLRLIMEPAGYFILAVGKSGSLLRAQMIVAAVELALIYPALKIFGIEGVAVAVTVAYIFEYIALYPVLYRKLSLGLSEWIAPVLPAFVSGFLAAGAVAAAAAVMPLSFAGMAGKIALFIFVYCAAYGIMTKWKMAAEIRDTIAEFRLKDGDIPKG